jgi:hypothetical protein
VALALLLAWGPREGAALMVWLNLLWTGVCVATLLAVGSGLKAWLPWRALGAGAGALLAVRGLVALYSAPAQLVLQFAAGGIAAGAVLALSWWLSPDLRAALRR